MDYYELNEGDIGAPCILEMGDAAACLLIQECCVGDGNAAIENLERIRKACSNITQVFTETDDIPLHGFRSLFVSPKPHLVAFDAFVSKNISATVTTLKVLAESVWTIENFLYEGPVPPASFLASFVNVNRNLAKVKIIISIPSIFPCSPARSRDGLMTETNWSPMLSALFRSTSVTEDEYSCDDPTGTKYASFANICTPARARGVAVSMSGFQYW